MDNDIDKRGPRSGILLRGGRVAPDVRQPFITFLRWLRIHYEFPVRVPVYLFPYETILTQDGDVVTASFFAPFDRNEEPLIRVAAGGFDDYIRQYGRDAAVGAYLNSLAHECVHYWQWLETGDIWERGVTVRAKHIVWDYYDDNGCYV